MTSAPLRVGEASHDSINPEERERLRILQAYGLDSLQDDPELEDIARFAARLCGVPVALVSLVDEERQRFLAREGLDQRDSPRDVSFCTHAMALGHLMVVRDAPQDARFTSNPYVIGEPFVRFYAGQPLISDEGIAIGALCVIGTEARPDGLTELQSDGLAILAQAVMRRLRSRRYSIAVRREQEERENYLRTLADSIPAIAWSADAKGKFEYFNQRMVEFTGKPNDTNGEAFHPQDWKKASAAWQHSLETGDPYEIEHRLCRHDGEYRWMISRAVPVRDAEGVIVRWFGTAVDIHDIYAASESRDLLAKELSHRIKNIFAVVSGLVSLSIRNRPDVQDFGNDLIATIRALGRAHDYVRPAQGNRRGTLNGMLNDLFAPYRRGDAPRIAVQGDDLNISARSATPLALVFHELATNSAKYGSLSVDEGGVDVTVTDHGETLMLRWVERGGPPPKSKFKEGFGSRLVEMSVTGQLDGWWERKFEPDGLVCELTVSRAAIAP